MMSISSAAVFFTIALLYAIVGFGGGSSYTAFLVLWETPYTLIPKISLLCNLIVVTGGGIQFYRAGHIRRDLILPFVITSVPMALVGGAIAIDRATFLAVLGVFLVIAGAQLMYETWARQSQVTHVTAIRKPLAWALGAVLGFISGLVGLGGGIFLSPLLLKLKWATPKQVAAAASVFIWVNSLAGLVGQLSKGLQAISESAQYWPLFVAVLLGGQIGSFLGIKTFSPVWVKRATAVLVLYVGGRLLFVRFLAG